jgi:redox-sensitive bicupin YhaK (pirin superfamily)
MASASLVNEDRTAPHAGLGKHGRRDMEILTYVQEGSLASLAHKQSMGHQEALGPNEIQRMSSGRGVRYSEFDRSIQQRAAAAPFVAQANRLTASLRSGSREANTASYNHS